MDKLGEKIKELRLQKNISQEGLAQGICNRSLISRIETENVMPNSEILYSISLKLGIPLEELFRYVQYSNYEYLKDFMHFTRKAVERRDYEEVKHILKLTSTSPEFKTGIARVFVLWHQGIITNYVDKDPLLAHHLLQEALGELQQTKHSDGKAMEVEIMNTKANIYLRQEELDQAANYYLKAQTLIWEMPFMELSELKIRINYNLSIVYMKQEKYENSLKYCEVGIQECQRSNSMYSLGELYYHKGLNLALLEKGNPSIFFDYALTIFKIQEKHEFYAYAKEKVK